jgi:hypothetical protein
VIQFAERLVRADYLEQAQTVMIHCTTTGFRGDFILRTSNIAPHHLPPTEPGKKERFAFGRPPRVLILGQCCPCDTNQNKNNEPRTYSVG